ncbi:MAG: DEAD/DEAH box helicase [Syntrophales bacterium]
MSLHPIKTLDAVIEEYRDYLRSEFRARDPQLRAALEAELDRPLFLAQEPFYQAHRPFRSLTRWDNLPLDPALAVAMQELSHSEIAYLHQSEAISHLLSASASPLVVTTGTGSGKTECFLLPVIQNAIQDVRQFPQHSGVTAIIVYPMNALANDQERRINDLLTAVGVAEIVDVRKYDRSTRQTEREQMRSTPPRILLTNYMMLEYLLVRPADRDAIFANHRCRFVVLDEVHTYRGILGSNIALLMRRLQAHLGRARQDWNTDVTGEAARLRFPRVVPVATSATIKSVNDPGLTEQERQRQRDEAVQDFFHRLTGGNRAEIRVIGEVLEDIHIPAASTFSTASPHIPDVDPENHTSVEYALCASAGIAPNGDLTRAARSCRLLWLMNKWLVRSPMSVESIDNLIRQEVPQRQSGSPEEVRAEIEAVLVAGAALGDDIPGTLRLRAHRMIRGGWKFVRCLDPVCGRIYPMGEPTCGCGRRTAPMFLCRSCGADYLRLSGEPDSGQMRPYDDAAEGREWMLYDPSRHEEAIPGDDEVEQEDPGPEGEQPRPRRVHRARVDQVRGQPVHTGSFDPATMMFSSDPTTYPTHVRLVNGRTRCLCCGGTAGTRNVITPVALGTSAAVKVLGEGLVEALHEANEDRPNHDGKERLLIFSDSRQDAAHQARFIIFASRFDRMRRRLTQILRDQGELSIQRIVELLGAAGVLARDNPHAPADLDRRLSEEERRRIRSWEEAPLLDEISVTPFFRGTLINLGFMGVRYEALNEEVMERGSELAARLGISKESLIHLCRCVLDEIRVRSMLSREMMRYHPKNPGCPDYIGTSDWERKVAQPKGLPVDGRGHPLAVADNAGAPSGVTIRNFWRREGRGGRAPNFQLLTERLLQRLGGNAPTVEDGQAIMDFLDRAGLLVTSDVYGLRDNARVTQLNAERVSLWIPLAEERFKCGVCSWPLSGAMLSAPCPRCHGSVVRWPDSDVHGHRTVRRLLKGIDLPLDAQEHTAQITTDRRIELENRFKAPANESTLNVLACSPTMEMGIDVGGLDAIILRNIPPRPDNYAQRGGRAGRRTRVGLVVGYARSTPHDQYFYDHPEEMISGEIPAPAISLGNRDVLLRHLCAIAFGAADPGLAGRMEEYVRPEGQIETERVQELINAVQSQIGYALDLARDAWGIEILTECGLSNDALRHHLEQLPAQIQRVIDATARQVLDLRQPLEAYAANVIGRQQGNRAADLVARLLGIRTGRRDGGGEASDSSAGYPLRRFAEFGVLPGYEFPSEPASLRLVGDLNEETPVNVARRFGIYQFMPEAPVYARGKRWKVLGLDMSSPWNPQVDVPWSYRVCGRCGLHFSEEHPACPRCNNSEAGRALPAFEFGGFLAFRNEAPVLDEEDRIAARNLVKFFPQWNGDVFERWSVGPGWALRLTRNEEVRWLNEGVEPNEVERRRGGLLHDDAKGFNLCPSCGRILTIPEDERPGRGRRQPRNARADRDPHGHAPQCPRMGEPPVPCAIVTSLQAEVLRLIVVLPERIEPEALDEWAHSLGAALRTGIRQHFVMDGSEIEFETEGPWQETGDTGSFQRMSLTFVDPSIGGSGYIPRIAREFHRVADRAIQHLDHPNCETACYRCLKSYQNQRHHDKLCWPLIMADLEGLAASRPQQLALHVGDGDDPRPWLDAYAAGVGSPLEHRFLRLFEDHGFYPQKQVPISPTSGERPISIADFAVPERRLAIYIDGAAFHIGDRLRRDRLIRGRLRQGSHPWRVVELRASDLSRGRSLVEELKAQ